MGIVTDKVAEAYQKLTRRKKEKQDTAESRFLALAIQIGRAELGTKLQESVDEDWQDGAQDILDEASLSFADLRATVDEFKRRFASAKFLKENKDSTAKSAAAGRAWKDADDAEGQRRREAIKNLERLAEAERHALALDDQATTARDNLGRNFFLSQEEKEANAAQQKLGNEIKPLENKLNPNASPGSGLSPMCHTHPASLARETRTALADIAAGKNGVNCSAERKSALEATLAAAETAVAAVQKELGELQPKLGEINRQLAAFSANRLYPESVGIVRAKATPDDRMKEIASKMGYASGQV